VKQKHKIICSIVLLNFIIFSCCFSFNVKAQEGPQHTIGFNEGTELVWEVTQLDLSSFRDVFGFDPNFELGDQIRMIIRKIHEPPGGYWIIDVEFWDYKTDWGLSGELTPLYIGEYPDDYDDYIFCLTPIDDYLDEVRAILPSEYYINGYSIFKQARSDTGKDYLWEKEFDTRGILAIETRYDEFDQVIVKLEGTFRIIPFGTYFIGFSLVAIIAVIFISLKKKKIRTTSI
jgi:hypothetical protein